MPGVTDSTKNQTFALQKSLEFTSVGRLGLGEAENPFLVGSDSYLARKALFFGAM
jgi:hypothetical protein